MLRIAGWVVATVLLLVCLREANSADAREALRHVRWPWIVAAVVANGAILVSWAGLWWTLAPTGERVRFARMFEINAIASALMNTVPFFGGHAAAAVLLVRLGGVTQQAALSILALDQLAEGVAKVSVFGAVALLAPLPDSMRVAIATACAVVGLLMASLLVVAHGHRRLRPPGEPVGMIGRVRTFLAEWASRMETLRSVRQSAVALVFALGTKAAEGVGIAAVQHAMGVEVSPGGTLLVLASVILGSVVPVAPGNVGTYEAAAFIAYRHLGVDPSQATILAIAAHLCFMVPSVGVGYLIGTGRIHSSAGSAK